MEELVCPNCKTPLNKIVEEYHSIGTYSYSSEKDSYIIENPRKNIKEEYKLYCPVCGNPIPSNLIDKIQMKLPKVY